MKKKNLDIVTKNAKLIDILRLNECMDKSSLANKLGVTWPTISTYVEELYNEGVIEKKDTGVSLEPSYGYFWGISVGSAQIKICLLNMALEKIRGDELNNIIDEDKVFQEQKAYMRQRNKAIDWYLYSETPTQIHELSQSINAIFDSIKTIVETHRELSFMGIGVAFTGTVDRTAKRILQAHNLPCMDGLDFEEGLLLRNHLDFFEREKIHISLENNSTAAGIAEKWALYDDMCADGEINTNQKYKDCKNVISIYLGAGFGLGIIQNNTVYRGSHDMPGGVGHLEVPNYGTSHDHNTSANNVCTCGNVNCLDNRIRTDVFKASLEDFKNWDSNKIRTYFDGKSDEQDLMGKYLGFLINTINNLLNPDLIIFSGKLHKSMDLLWEAIQRKRNENPLKHTKSNCSLIKSSLGAAAPTVGAAITAYYDCFNVKPDWNL